MRSRRRDDRGVALILVSLSMVAMLLIAAIVIDLGSLRNSARQDQSIADFAALAAGQKLGLADFDGACEAAINSINTNAVGIPGITASSFCTTMNSTVCSDPISGSSQATPSTTSGKYTVTVHYPVPDTEIADAVYGAGKKDGTACERMRVIVTTSEPALLGTVAGHAGYSATRSATVKAAQGISKRVPALWLLDPTGCVSLAVSGGSQITVGDTTASPIVPGFVAIDSDGTGCTGSSTTVSATGSGTVVKAIPTTGDTIGQIRLRAMPKSATSCAASTRHDCAQTDIDNSRLLPQPTPGGRTTRAPVDWRWNCKTSYPNYHGVLVPGCDDALATPPTPAYLDQLRTAVGTTGMPSSGTWNRWSTAGYGCNPGGVIAVTGNWWVDCSSFSVGNGTSVSFGGNVVFDGDVGMSNGGTLRLNWGTTAATLPASCVTTLCVGTAAQTAAFVYVRGSHDISMTGGSFVANNAMVYVNDGIVSVNSAPPTWLAPTDGPFKGLALWAEKSSSGFSMAGGAGVNLRGSFFTPEAAPFSLTGGGNWAQQNAQFISYQLKVSGGGQLAMAPDPNIAITVPPEAGVLIR